MVLTTNILTMKKMVSSRGLILTTVLVVVVAVLMLLVGPSMVFVRGTIRRA
jgi:hypothetical protein